MSPSETDAVVLRQTRENQIPLGRNQRDALSLLVHSAAPDVQSKPVPLPDGTEDHYT